MIGAPARRRRNAARPGAPERRVIPFDYAFRFSLNGEPGATASSAIEVSVEGAFTAVSIGYGVVPEVHPVVFGIAPASFLERLRDLDAAGQERLSFDQVPLRFLIAAIAEQLGETPPVDPVKFTPGAISAVPAGTAAHTFAAHPSIAKIPLQVLTAAAEPPGPRTATALRSGLRLNPEFAELLLQADRRDVPVEALGRCFQLVAAPPGDVQFRYALFDDATGREFQNEPILNTAGLGAADGGRPFRYFARPIEFGPRSRIRMQITEVGDFRGELHVSLQGYKRLGEAGTPTGRTGP